MDEYRMHTLEEAQKEDRLIRAQLQNTENIKLLTEATKGMVDAWTAANSFQKLIKWLSSFAVLGFVISWVSSKFSSLNIF